MGVMNGEGDTSERGVRGLYKGDSKDVDMAALDTTTLLKEFPLVGHGGVVGSPVAHRRGRRRGQAKAAAVPVGLVGSRYAVLAEAREDDMLAGAEVCAVQENSGVAELIPQAGDAPAAPQVAEHFAGAAGVQALFLPVLNKRARRAAAAAAAEHSASDLPRCDADFPPLRAGNPGLQHFNAASCQQGSFTGPGTLVQAARVCRQVVGHCAQAARACSTGWLSEQPQKIAIRAAGRALGATPNMWAKFEAICIRVRTILQKALGHRLQVP